jgi:hypothetical protein
MTDDLEQGEVKSVSLVLEPAMANDADQHGSLF